MKVVAVVQARMDSERLPGKVMKHLSGKPVLWHIIQILSKVDLIDEIVIATTTLSNDDIIEDLCLKETIRLVRGSVNDVLDRFRTAAITTNADVLVRITGDDPCMDFNIINNIISTHLKSKSDYTSNMIKRTFPRGMDTEVFNVSAIAQAWQTTSNPDDREHVTLFIRNSPDKFKLKNISSSTFTNRSDLRLCVDTVEDYNLVNLIYENCYKNSPLLLKEILDFLDDNNEMALINSNIEQKKINGITY
jgi:spore coat polysaccharide biosynthesis protein SpsF